MTSAKMNTRPRRPAKTGRRAFLQTAGATGALAVASPLIGAKAARAQPKKGGHLRVGLAHGSTTDSLDPRTYENNFASGIGFTINGYIGEVLPNGAMVPEGAESWEAGDDAKTWVFKVRPGVEFHNGKTLDAEDVVASVNLHRGETKSAAKSLVEQIEDIKADGKDQVVVTLKGGNADFPYVISDYHIAILPAKNGEIDNAAAGIGIGPYKITSYEPGIRATFEKNPNYFKSDRGHFDSLEFLSIIDTTARTNALATGEIDLMDRCDLKTVHLLGRNPNLKIQDVTGTLHYTFPMRTDTPPFDDNNVRMALKHALDREEVVQKILKGFGVVGNDHPIGPSNQYYASALPQRTYDPEKAKWYLKQSGLDSLAVELSASEAAFAGAVDAATLYREHAAKAGIDITIVREPNDGYWSNVWMKKPWCACYWSGRPTEDWMFTSTYLGGADWNDTFWKNQRFDTLLVEARAELNSDKRRAMYVEMQEIVRDDGGAVIPMFANYVFAMSDKLQTGDEIAGNWDLDGFKFAERWWFA